MAGLVTIEEYNKLIDERPRKFGAEQVGYQEKAPRGQYQVCGLCLHWYQSPMARRNTCEIYRGSPEKSIPAAAFCLFWTKNGKDFPLLEKDRSRISTLIPGEEK